MKHYNTIEKSQIMFGDNMKLMDKLPAYSFSLIITDPPYLFSKHCGKEESVKDGRKKINNSALYDYGDNSGMCRIKNGLTNEQIEAWLDKTVRLMRKYNAYIFCSEEQIADYHMWAKRMGYKFSILIWEKPVSIISKQRFCQNVEFIVRIYENGTSLNKFEDSSMYGRVFRYGSLKKKLHPTQKPLELVKRLMLLSSNESDAVLDPFMGSGTTCIAALMLGRTYVGMDNNENFFSVAKNRIEEYNTQMYANQQRD